VEYPDPVACSGEVLVRVAATSVNPVDYKRCAGLTKDFYPLHFPGLIGVDISGTVIKIVPGVEASETAVSAENRKGSSTLWVWEARYRESGAMMEPSQIHADPISKPYGFNP
jgi:NADPH:quinone reductase-like Zn-dependent oxidoreductase